MILPYPEIAQEPKMDLLVLPGIVVSRNTTTIDEGILVRPQHMDKRSGLIKSINFSSV